MKLRKPRPKTIVYLLLTFAAAIGLVIYNSDSNPPSLDSISFSKQQISLGDADKTIGFSLRVSDARGVETAELRCLEANQTRLLSRIVMSGSFAGRVSFGATGSSYNWVSSWDGNRYDFTVDAVGELPEKIQPLSCEWFAYLEDELGNASLEPTGFDLTITG